MYLNSNIYSRSSKKKIMNIVCESVSNHNSILRNDKKVINLCRQVSGSSFFRSLFDN